MSEAKSSGEEFVVRVGEEERRTDSYTTITKWRTEGTLPGDAWIYHPAWREWRRADSIAARNHGRTVLKFVFVIVVGLPLLGLGACVACGVGVVSYTSRKERTARGHLAAATSKVARHDCAGATKDLDLAVDAASSGADSKLEASARVARGTCKALLGDSVGANSDFDIALAKDSEVKPLIAMPLVTAAFDAATRRRAGQADERERRAQERRVASEGEGGRGKEPDRVDAKSAIKSWIRDNVADADAEVLDVDSPRAEGRYWVVRARVRGKNAFGGPVIDAKDFYLQVDKDASWGVRLYEVKFAR